MDDTPTPSIAIYGGAVQHVRVDHNDTSGSRLRVCQTHISVARLLSGIVRSGDQPGRAIAHVHRIKYPNRIGRNEALGSDWAFISVQRLSSLSLQGFQRI